MRRSWLTSRPCEGAASGTLTDDCLIADLIDRLPSLSFNSYISGLSIQSRHWPEHED